MHDIINSSDSEPFTLYNDCVMDTFYNRAECRDNVFRIGNMHWTDDWIE